MIKQEDIQTHRYILTRDSIYPKDFVKVSAAGCTGPSSRYYTIPTFLKAHKDQLLIEWLNQNISKKTSVNDKMKKKRLKF